MVTEIDLGFPGASVRCPPVIQSHRPLLPFCRSSLIDHSSPPARSNPEARRILDRLPSSYIRLHAPVPYLTPYGVLGWLLT